jgi:hypothetical protein
MMTRSTGYYDESDNPSNGWRAPEPRAPRKQKGSVELQICWRCNGTGVYQWGASINGRMTHQGPCFKCIGGGEFPVTNGAAWFTKYGRQILDSITVMARACDLDDEDVVCQRCASIVPGRRTIWIEGTGNVCHSHITREGGVR